MTNWFKFEKTAPNSVDIHIIDFIGDWMDDYWGMGVTARSFISQLKELPETVDSIRVLINSPGGDTFAGLTIANALRMQHAEHGRAVETYVIGIAASAASLIAMAGQTVSVADNAVVMIHNPYSFTIGGATEHRQAAHALDTTKDSILATYKWHTSLTKAEIADLMDEETFLSADEAVAKGFATRKVSGKFAVNKFAPSVVAKLKFPAKLSEFAKSITRPHRDFVIVKSDPVKKQCFGWASVAVSVDGVEVIDAHEHVIESAELEQAAYQFNLLHREADEDHTEAVVGTLIESLVVTPDKLAAMGLPANALHQGWWVGFQLTDDKVFAKVVSGEYRMFSIAGTASMEEIQ